MEKNKTMWAWVGLAIVVVVLIYCAVLWGLGMSPVYQPPVTQTTPTSTTPAGTNQPPVNAPAGQLISGFPQALVLDPGTEFSTSYSIVDSANDIQYTAEWITQNSLDKIFQDYKAYFQANGWTIENSTPSGSVRTIYATKGGTTATLLAKANPDPAGKGSKVIVSYLTGQ